MLTLLLAAALAFPVPASPPIPVTEPILGRPPFRQSGIHLATNGSMALAVWNDQRSGFETVTATRINAAGMPLDPTGIVIQNGGTVKDVFWTGAAFAVVTLPDAPPVPEFPGISSVTSYDYMVTYVGADGAVTPPNPVASNQMQYASRSNDGPDAHLLFLPSDGFSRLGLVVDLQGKVLRQGATDTDYAYTLTATNGSAFLVLRYFSERGSFVAETLDRDGNWGESNDPRLPATFSPAALTRDGRGGYAVLGYMPSLKEFGVVRLDAAGVAAGAFQVIQNYDPTTAYRAYGQSVTATSTPTGFVASWNATAPNGHTVTYVSRDGGAPEVRHDWIGAGLDTAYDPVNDLVLTSIDETATSTEADLFVQKGSGPPVPLTYSANFQTWAAIAAVANGFVAAWTENSGTDSRVYIRRFASDATPLDQAQIADSRPMPVEYDMEFQNASVTVAGSSYLVTWDIFYARRFDARDERWLDAAPFPLNALATASNGSDVLALTLEKCPDLPCVMARRVAMSGGAVVSAGSMLSGAGSDMAIASDGTNYLAAWTDSSGVVARRLRPDGSPIDAAPIALGPAFSEAHPSIAWNGKTYLVAWGGIAAAYVGSDGVVRQLGTIVDLHSTVISLKAVAHDGTFVIFSRHWPPYLSTPYVPGVLTVTLLDGSTTTLDLDLGGSPGFSPRAAFLDAASDGAHLMLTYARLDSQAGRISRVVLDPRVIPSRKRAVR